MSGTLPARAPAAPAAVPPARSAGSLPGTTSRSRATSAEVPDRLGEPRSDALLDGQPHAHRLRDDEDIAEDDRRVDADEVHRLEGDLHRQLRCAHHREEVRPRAHGAIFGQVATGLTHHPDGRPLDRLAPAGPEEEIVHRASRARTPATSASTVGRAATAAGSQPEARAVAAVVGPTASNGGRSPSGQARASRAATLGTGDDQHPRALRCAPRGKLSGQHRSVTDHLFHLDAVGPQADRQLIAADVSARKEDRSSHTRRRASPARARRRRRTLQPTAPKAAVRVRARSPTPRRCRSRPPKRRGRSSGRSLPCRIRNPQAERRRRSGGRDRHRVEAAQVAKRVVHGRPVERRLEGDQWAFLHRRGYRAQCLHQSGKASLRRRHHDRTRHQGSETTADAADRAEARISAAPRASSRSARSVPIAAAVCSSPAAVLLDSLHRLLS